MLGECRERPEHLVLAVRGILDHGLQKLLPSRAVLAVTFARDERLGFAVVVHQGGYATASRGDVKIHFHLVPDHDPTTGGGAVYATSVGHAVKWFPDRRGLAVGLTAAGYGAGAALTVIPIRYVIDGYGYEAAFFWFGLIQGGIAFVLAWFLLLYQNGFHAG